MVMIARKKNILKKWKYNTTFGIINNKNKFEIFPNFI